MENSVYFYLYHAIKGIKSDYYSTEHNPINRDELNEVLKGANFKFSINFPKEIELDKFIEEIEEKIENCKFFIFKYNLSSGEKEESFTIIIRNGSIKRHYNEILFTEEEERRIKEEFSHIQPYFEHLEAIKGCNTFDEETIQENTDLINVHSYLLRDELLFLNIRRDVTVFTNAVEHDFDDYRDLFILLHGDLEYYKDLEKITFLPCEKFIYDFIQRLYNNNLIKLYDVFSDYEDYIGFFLPPLLVYEIQRIDFEKRKKIFYEVKELNEISDMDSYLSYNPLAKSTLYELLRIDFLNYEDIRLEYKNNLIFIYI